MKYILSILLVSFIYFAQAEEFQAPVTDTKWQIIESPLECSLTQVIPSFGEAGFRRVNGGPLELFFKTTSQPATQNNVAFEISAAPWQNTDQFEPLVSMPTSKGQREFAVNGVLAQQALTNMQDGRFPLIRYRSQTYTGDVVAKLSTVKFNDSSSAFNQCLSNLYPDSFDEINNLTIYFESEKAVLTKKATQALTRIADYLKIDDTVKQMTITAHTDNYGRKRLNVPLSEARARVIRDFFIEKQVLENDQVVMQSFVDHDPAATNKTASGRAYNRRAEITLSR